MVSMKQDETMANGLIPGQYFSSLSIIQQKKGTKKKIHLVFLLLLWFSTVVMLLQKFNTLSSPMRHFQSMLSQDSLLCFSSTQTPFS